MTRPHQVMTRLTEDEFGWLMARVTAEKNISEALRECIAIVRKVEERAQCKP